MVEGFEKETHELTDYELQIAPKIAGGLRRKIGKTNAVTSSHIIQAFKAAGYKLDGARLRKIINHIRVKNLVPNLIATSKGYYVADQEKDCRSYIESLEQRAREILHVRDAMLLQLNQTINSQPR